MSGSGGWLIYLWWLVDLVGSVCLLGSPPFTLTQSRADRPPEVHLWFQGTSYIRIEYHLTIRIIIQLWWEEGCFGAHFSLVIKRSLIYTES
jgi:hypothetical protein